MSADLIRDFGLLGAALIVVIGAVATTLRVAVPRLTESWIRMKEKQSEAELEARKAQREAAAEEDQAGRQNEIALLSQVIQLSSQVQSQNRELITFITATLRTDLQAHRTEIMAAVKDIDQRWVTASRELASGCAKTQMLTAEIAELKERFTIVEQTLRNALNGRLGRES